MCGIVGLFIKDKRLEPQLGSLLTDMLIAMSDRGPDSAGVAIYSSDVNDQSKLTIQSNNPDVELENFAADLSKVLNVEVSMRRVDSHAVISLPTGKTEVARMKISELRPNIQVMSEGYAIEIYKEVGLPNEVAAKFDLPAMSGTHGIGHTRMATESAVNTEGAHPYSTGTDQCLVHNGSLSNHNNLRRHLVREGLRIESDNDTEVGAAYLTWKMQTGSTLRDSLQDSLEDLDGFFTFVVGTRNGFGIVRDPIACKPAVMAETDQFVAFGSEYRALVGLPAIESATVWEPEPATVYFWSHNDAEI